MTAAVDEAIEEAIALLAAGSPRAGRVARALRIWTAGPNITFEEALGIGQTWRRARLQRRRDQLVRQIAAQCPNLVGRSLARKIDEDLDAYERSRWPRDRARGMCSESDSIYFDIMALGVPRLGFHGIRAVLAKQKVGEYPNPRRCSAQSEETDRHAPPASSDCNG